MKYKSILVEKKADIGIITLNRPEKLNAINLTMKREIHQALSELEKDDDVRVVILAGAGRAFSSGHDMTSSPSEEEQFPSLEEEEKLLHFEKPIIAAIHGYVLGDGLQQALLCDIIIASEDSVLGFIGAQMGSLCSASFTILPAVVGRKKASELLLTCDRITAREACDIGLVNKVVPNDRLIPEAMAMAQKIARLPPLSIKYTKRALGTELVNETHRHVLEEGYPVVSASEDKKEARRAFSEKRPPVFRGK